MIKHENLFYSYRDSHLEDNVTRAFIVTLKQLSPVNLRVFITDLLKLKGNKIELAENINPIQEAEIEYKLQEVIDYDDDELEEEELLDKNTGVIIGLSSEKGESISKIVEPSNDRRGRLDAQIIDENNEVTVIFESKLGSPPGERQISKYYNTLFSTKDSLEDVYLNRTWEEVVESLERINSLCRQDSVERFFIEEFITYLSYLRLIEFRGFSETDFEKNNKKELLRFLNYSLDNEESLGIKLKGERKIYFQDVGNKNENIFITINENGLNTIIVCGVARKNRANALFNMVSNQKDTFKALIRKLNKDIKDIDEDYRIYLVLNSRFYHSKFRNTILPIEVIEYNTHREEALEKFVKLFTDKNKNTFKWLDKEKIYELFSSEINKSGKVLDKNGYFPKWDDVESLLQHYYFDIQVFIPKNKLIGRERNKLAEEFREVLKAGKTAIERIGDAVRKV